ncbi:MAG TPA: hypothetical protein PK926_03875 [Spirochaetota bacterium]|nr:hypothetical protein [Spirochaetota bacterium]HPI89434.1 hypothetical protein [Spirochaetota bacterium]HPR46898.1 hypothetical protein [Spirochaetota bacterium]
MRTEFVTTGITFGTALAIAISYSANHSVPWAIFHGLLSWVYVIYHVIVH